MTRTGKIARALTVGYGYQLTVAVTGLVLTRLLLSQLGVDSYGRWLVVGQVLGLLGLLDLGVTAVLPREVARACGTEQENAIAMIVQRATWLVWLQTPLVGLVSLLVWLGVSTHRPELTGPLAVILLVFVIQFPLRVYASILNGLQDLTFCGLAQAVSWAVTTLVMVVLVFAGWGFYALATSWAAGQLLGCGLCWLRVRRCFPKVRKLKGWPGSAALTGHVWPSFWNSISQLAGLLLNGTELIVLEWIAGPGAVVVYACTVKLIALLNNQPYLLMNAALPAVAELHAAGDRERLWRATRAVGLGMLLFSGALALAALAVNSAFVPRWVGTENYGGPALTLLAVLAMLARHATYTLMQPVFAFGYDRRLALSSVVDGIMTLAATGAWTVLYGPIGVPLGTLTGLFLTNWPVALYTLAEVEGVSLYQAIRWQLPLLLRFAAVAGPLAALSFTTAAESPVTAALLAVGSLAVYVVLVLPLLARDPLRAYRQLFLAVIRRKLKLAPIA